MAQGGATATVSAFFAACWVVGWSCMITLPPAPISLAAEHLQGRRDDVLRLEAEVALQFLERGRRAEGLHADHPALVADIALPAHRRCLLDGKPRLHRRRQHLLAVGLRLVLEDVP